MHGSSILQPLPTTGTVAPLARRLRALVSRDGGGTVERVTGRPIAEGIAVSADPRAARDLRLADWDDRLVTAWVVVMAPVLAARDAHLGAWLDPCAGRVWVEPVWVLPTGALALARAIGRAHDQRAVYDLGRRRLVPLVPATPIGPITPAGSVRA
jgi:hypothetical protein